MSAASRSAEGFLAGAGWSDAKRAPLAGDASNRRYERLSNGPGGRRAVLMDAPPERGEDIAAFVAVTGRLRALGFSAPEIFAADLAEGWALLEDLGDDLFARVAAARPAKERALYEAAIDVLLSLAETPPPEVATGYGARHEVPPYDGDTLAREARLAIDWWRKGVSGAAPGPGLTADYDAAVKGACARVAADRSVLVLRDYHAENLIWLPDRRGDARVGLLDYQDALAGSPAYDLVSLLEDARRDTGAELRAAMMARYADRAGMDSATRDAFAADCAALAAQRNLKIVGIFARLWLRDGKPAYLDMIPRVWAHLQRDLAHPLLGDLRALVAAEIPAPTEANLNAIRGARA